MTNEALAAGLGRCVTCAIAWGIQRDDLIPQRILRKTEWGCHRIRRARRYYRWVSLWYYSVRLLATYVSQSPRPSDIDLKLFADWYVYLQIA